MIRNWTLALAGNHKTDLLQSDQDDTGVWTPLVSGSGSIGGIAPFGYAPFTAHIDASEPAAVPKTQVPADSGTSGGDPDGQLWIGAGGDGVGNPDGISDYRIYHADSDGLADDRVVANSSPSLGGYYAIGLDTAAKLYFAVSDSDDTMHVYNMATGAQLSSKVIVSEADQDLFDGFVINTTTHTIYTSIFGGDWKDANPGSGALHGADIIKMAYDPTTGIITSPYSPTITDPNNPTGQPGAITDTTGILLDSGSTGNKYGITRGMWLTPDGNTLYYADDNDNDVAGDWGYHTNGIFKVGTSGSVGGQNAPTPVELTVDSQFNTVANETIGGNQVSTYTNGYISGLTVDQAKGLIYFTTSSYGNNIDPQNDAVWYLPISPSAGTLAVKMTLPGGVTLKYPSFISASNIVLDPYAQQLYISDAQSPSHIIQLTLSADGHSFTSGVNDFAPFDTNGVADGADSESLAFDALPALSGVNGTTTEVVQGGSGVTLLTGAPGIADPDSVNIAGASVVITNAQAGDNLLVNGQQSGTIDGGKVSVSWNSTTHTLTLSGDVAETDYQTLLDQVSFQDSGSDTTTAGSHPARSFTFIANDGVTVVHPSTSDPNERS